MRNDGKEPRSVDVDAWSCYAAGWAITVEQEGDRFKASLPFRSLTSEAGSEEEARAGLLRLMCELSRNGSFDPHNPDARGVPPVQHALEVLYEELGNQLNLRRGAVLPFRDDNDEPENEVSYDADVGKRSDVLSGVATALASLARVKAL
jgi:hypothetical protein